MSDSAAGTRTCWNCGDEVPTAAEVCETCGAPRHREGASTGAEQKRLDIGDVFAERYEIRGITAEGALGDVYKVQDREIGVSLALKVIHGHLIGDEGRRKALRNAIKKARRFLHKNVVKLYESGESGGRVYFTMEFLGGVSLRKLIQVRADAGQHFTLEESAPILEQLAGVLDEAHQQGLRHGSLKPDNIIILPTGLKLSELGVAGFLPPKDLIGVQQKQGAEKYLAPEHATGAEVTARTDVYALGAILYEMLTGAPPDGPGAPLASETNEAVVPAIDELLSRCLDADPNKRPATAGAIYAAIAAVMSGEAEAPAEKALAEAAPVVEAPVAEPAPVEEPPPAEEVEPVEEVHEAEPVEEGGQAAVDAWNDIRPAQAEGIPEAEEEAERGPIGAADVSFPDETTLDEEKPPTPSSAKAIPKKSGRKAPPPVQPAKSAPPPKAAEAPKPRKPAPPPSVPSHPTPPPPPATAPVAQSKSKVGLIVGVLAIIAVIGGGAFFALSGGKEEAPRETVQVAPQAKPSELSKKEPEVAKPAAEPPPTQPSAEELARRRAEEEAKRKADEEAKKRSDEQARIRAEEDRRKAEEAKQRAEEERQRREAAALAAKSKCPSGMIEIPGGSFNMGSKSNDSARDTWEKSFEPTQVGGFCVDQYEFPGKPGEVPRIGVTWEQARALCSGRGKRLCTEEEWEKACKGKANTRYPYGDRYQADACNTKDASGNARALSPAGSFEGCKSDYGVTDMSGSVKEWTDSFWSDVVKDRVVRGGSYSRPDWATRCAFRENFQESHSDDQIGFRCCKDF